MKIISTIDSHTAGESTRLVTSGLPPLRGQSMEARLLDAREHLAWLPGLLLLEPRGHKDLYGAILTSPCHPEADVGVVFMNNQGFEPMCGHGVIGVVTSLLETGMFATREPETTLLLDTAAGLVTCRAQVRDGRVLGVAFDNVPSFAYKLDFPLSLPHDRQVMVDIAFGGNFFVLVNARLLAIELKPSNAPLLASLGMQILAAANTQVVVRHPKLTYIDQILDLRFYLEPGSQGAHSRNVVILGDHMVDRSPCGTGTSAELAVRYARHQVQVGEPLITESIIGTRFTGQVVTEVKDEQAAFPYPVIIPRIQGRAYLTGLHQFVLSPDDPFPMGFMLRD